MTKEEINKYIENKLKNDDIHIVYGTKNVPIDINAVNAFYYLEMLLSYFVDREEHIIIYWPTWMAIRTLCGNSMNEITNKLIDNIYNCNIYNITLKTYKAIPKTRDYGNVYILIKGNKTEACAIIRWVHNPEP